MPVIVTLSGVYAYANLKLAIADWMARSDLSEETIDTTIDLAEAKLNRTLRVRAMETVYLRPLDADGRVGVPTGYREFKDIYLYHGTGGVDVLPSSTQSLVSRLEMTNLNSLMTDFNVGSTSARRMARSGEYFYVGGKPDTAYSVGGIYYKTFPALTDANQNNWLTDTAPDLLFAACLEQACLYVKEYSQAEQWRDRFQQMLDDVMYEDRRESHSGGLFVTRSGVRGA